MIRHVIAAAFCCLLALPAKAGTSCEHVQPSVATIRTADAAASALWRTLEESGAETAIIGRVGSDISAYGLRYTHAGFAFRDHPKGKWLLRHMLNHCGRDSSGIYDQGLLNFYLDDLFAYDVLVLIPTPELQHRLENVVLSDQAVRLHEPAYSMLAYMFSTRYQNSNQWLLEAFALAEAGRRDDMSRQAAQRILKDSGFEPEIIALSPLKRLGASLFSANVHFDDHPPELDLANRFATASVRSVERYLDRRGLLIRRFVLPAPGSGRQAYLE